MSGKLTNGQRHQLEKWIGTGAKDFQLQYSITRDGCNSQTFHTKCNNQGPTVTVLYNPNGSVYGGYTAMDWNSSNVYVSDTAAFLFRLQYNSSDTFNKFPVITGQQGKAIYCHSSYGPVFGAGHDLCTFSGTINNSGSYYTLNGGQNYGSSYDIQGVTAAQINNGDLNVTELEVYGVNDVHLEKEWRKSPSFSTEVFQEMIAEIESHCPAKQLSIPRFNILLVGPVGAGKSSFFNTVTSVFRGYVTSQARSGSSERSLTSAYHMYNIQAGITNKPLGFRLCDTRGIEEGQGLDAHEMTFILDGHVPNRYKFNPAVPISMDIPGFIKSPTEKEKIHCVCFIMDGSSFDVLPEKILEKIKSIQAYINQREIPQVVLLTKVDRICPYVEDDVSTVFKSPRVRDVVEKVSQTLGFPRGHVHPVKNYESETDLDENVNILTLLALRQILRSCQDHLYNLLEDLEDRMPSPGAKKKH